MSHGEELAYKFPRLRISACEYDAPMTFRCGSGAGVSLFLRELFDDVVRQKGDAVLDGVSVSFHFSQHQTVALGSVLTRFDL